MLQNLEARWLVVGLVVSSLMASCTLSSDDNVKTDSDEGTVDESSSTDQSLTTQAQRIFAAGFVTGGSFVVYSDDVLKTTTPSWHDASPENALLTDAGGSRNLLLDPFNSGAGFLMTAKALFYNPDLANVKTWQRIFDQKLFESKFNDGPPPTKYDHVQIVVHPGKRGYIAMALRARPDADSSTYVVVSTDYGKHWSTSGALATKPLLAGPVDLAACPVTNEVFLTTHAITAGSNIFRSTNGGLTFDRYDYDLGLPTGIPRNKPTHITAVPRTGRVPGESRCDLYAYNAGQPIVVYRNEPPVAFPGGTQALPFKVASTLLESATGNPGKLQPIDGSPTRFVFSAGPPAGEKYKQCYETKNAFGSLGTPFYCGNGGAYALFPQSGTDMVTVFNNNAISLRVELVTGSAHTRESRLGDLHDVVKKRHGGTAGIGCARVVVAPGPTPVTTPGSGGVKGGRVSSRGR